MEFYPKYRLKGHRDSLYAICGDEHPDFFFTAGGDGLVARWSANADDDATLLVKVPATVYSLLLLHQHLLVATREGGIHWVNLEEKAEKKLFSWNNAPVFMLEKTDNGWYSGHGDGRLIRWQLYGDSAEIIGQNHLVQEAVRTIKKSGELLAAGYSDHSIRIFNDQMQEISRFDGHSNSIFSLLWLQNGKYLLSGSRDATIRIWELSSGTCIETIQAHWYTVNDIIALPEVNLIASTSRDKSIKLWDAHSMELKKVVDYEKFPGLAHSHSVNRLFWNANHQALFSVGDDRLVIRHQVVL